MAAEIALCALDRGLEVAALVEVLPVAQAAPAQLAALAARGVAIRTGATISRAESDGLGLHAAVLRHADGAEECIACDTICLAIGAVPVIDLAAAAGCRVAYDGHLGGHVPVLSALGASSVAGMFCTGDCAGLSSAANCDAQGRMAAQAAAAWLEGREPPVATPAEAAGADTTAYRMAWMRTLLAEGGMQAPVCLCEEVSRAELLGVKPPRYLGCASAPMAARDGQTLLRDGPLNPDQIKRLTRAGMGVCQGRRCREQIALLLAVEGDTVAGRGAAGQLPRAGPPVAAARAGGCRDDARRVGCVVRDTHAVGDLRRDRHGRRGGDAGGEHARLRQEERAFFSEEKKQRTFARLSRTGMEAVLP